MTDPVAADGARPLVERGEPRRGATVGVIAGVNEQQPVHRHPQITAVLGEGAFLKPSALWWLLSGGYRAFPDRSLSGLATPARISLAVILLGLALAGILWLWSVAP